MRVRTHVELLSKTTDIVCHKMFIPDETKYSSTHRELIAILYILEAFGDMLYNSRIKWFTDNQSTARIVEVGSIKFNLQVLTYQMFFTLHEK